MSAAIIQKPFKLLAKSRYGNREVSLEEHLLDTAKAARLIFGLDTRVGRNYCKAFKLDSEESIAFLDNLEIACLFHDIGKANEGFLNAVNGVRNAQVIRHEHLSALILQLKEVREWLGSGKINILYPHIVSAVLSHHLKAEKGKIGDTPLGSLKSSAPLYLAHEEVQNILERISMLANIGTPLKLNHQFFNKSKEPWSSCIVQLDSDGQRFRRGLSLLTPTSIRDRKMVAALKTALIVADSVASALVRQERSLELWIQDNVHIPRISKDELWQKVITPRTKNIEERSGHQFQFHPFQTAASMLPSRSAILSACGSGKTMAGLLWAANQLSNGEFGRIILLYPTRGTATEGFKDYIGWAPEAEAQLLHGASQYVLDSIYTNPPDSADGKDFRVSEFDARLFGLQNYRRRFFSATIDQFFAFLEHSYSSLCMTPILSDSVVILDEIHSFDKGLFNSVLEYLHSLDIPTLCMTATLPVHRKRKLIDAGITFFPDLGQPTKELVDLIEKQGHKRYQLSRVKDCEEGLLLALDGLRRGRKILWVVNTVKRCQQVARQLSEHFENIIVYHSRFRLKDREAHHAECINSFRFDSASLNGVIAITTQVCEMSLDLDADQMISEVAPVPSLIQRFGRANRHLTNRSPDFLAPLYVYSPGSMKPYNQAEIAFGEAFVNQLLSIDGGTLSQTDMASLMDEYSGEEALEPSCRLFESGYFATPGELRDIDEFTRPAILDDDIENACKLILERKPIDALIVHVPKKFIFEPAPSPLPTYLGIARSSSYSEQFGFICEEPSNG